MHYWVSCGERTALVARGDLWRTASSLFSLWRLQMFKKKKKILESISCMSGSPFGLKRQTKTMLFCFLFTLMQCLNKWMEVRVYGETRSHVKKSAKSVQLPPQSCLIQKCLSDFRWPCPVNGQVSACVELWLREHRGSHTLSIKCCVCWHYEMCVHYRHGPAAVTVWALCFLKVLLLYLMKTKYKRRGLRYNLNLSSQTQVCLKIENCNLCRTVAFSFSVKMLDDDTTTT